MAGKQIVENLRSQLFRNSKIVQLFSGCPCFHFLALIHWDFQTFVFIHSNVRGFFITIRTWKYQILKLQGLTWTTLTITIKGKKGKTAHRWLTMSRTGSKTHTHSSHLHLHVERVAVTLSLAAWEYRRGAEGSMGDQWGMCGCGRARMLSRAEAQLLPLRGRITKGFW